MRKNAENLKIVEFEDMWAEAYASLNYEWISKYFTIEKHDREVLDNPRVWVLDPGGQIFIALIEGNPVGTVAMIPAGNEMLELTKMAVAPERRGLGIGDTLIDVAVAYAQQVEANVIFLESHTALQPALALYRKHGFVEVPGDPNSQYARADIRMELAVPSRS